MLRLIREVRPTYIVGENVSGLVNWSDGLVFDEVQSDLEAIGYEVQAFILPACAVNAPHRRDRVWIVAHAKSGYDRGNAGKFQEQNEQEREEGQEKRFSEFGGAGKVFATNTNGERHEERDITTVTGKQKRQHCKEDFKFRNTDWHDFPTQSPICVGNDGFPAELDGITFPKWRNESIKAAGNAVVPQVVLKIFEAINEVNKTNNFHSLLNILKHFKTITHGN